MEKRVWTVTEAKANLNKLIDRAKTGGPQAITRRGVKVAVMLPVEGPKRKPKRVGNLAEFFAASPLRGSDLVVQRSRED